MSATPRPVRDKRLAGLAGLVDLWALRLPLAIQVLQESTSFHDGWTTRGDEPNVTTSGAASSVEATAIAVDAARREIAQIYDDVDTVAVMIHDALRMVDRIVGRRPPERIEPKLCNCTGRDGAEKPWTPGQPLAAGNGWSNPACRNVASRGALCESCSLREWRWRNHHGLAPRTDGVFSQAGPEVA